MKTLMALLSLAVLGGCSQKKGTDELSCPAVADKVVEIIKAETGKLPEEQRKALGAQLATIRSEVIEDCTRDPDFFAAKSACIMRAASQADLEACEGETGGAKEPPSDEERANPSR